MGRFKGKSSSEAKAKRDFVRINPYEISEKALAVIANICSKNNTDDANPIYQAIRAELEHKGKDGLDFYEFIDNDHYRKYLYNFDLLVDLRTQLSQLFQELLAHENTNDTQVVVAGGFSAGKSSFLIALTGAGDLLPTGIEPCSMVQTYLYCSKRTPEIVVKGVNLKDAVVLLDRDILQSIQHESKSKVYLASVLDKLFVEVPSENLDGFVFIDTPGYNNSDKKNVTNNATDEETAMDAINRGNVLLWVIDAGGGTIPKNDMKIIRDFVQNGEDRKIAVVFNKADKKGEDEIRKVVREAFSLISDLGEAVIDVFGFSSQENRIYYSYNEYDMERLLMELRRSGTGNSGIQRREEALLELFDDEVIYANEARNAYEKDKKDLISQKNEAYKRFQEETDGTKKYVSEITDIMVNNYDSILKTVDKLGENGAKVLDRWLDDLNAIYEDENSKLASHDSVLLKISNSGKNRDRLVGTHNRLVKYNYYTKDYREDWVERIKVQLERVDEGLLKAEYEGLENAIDSTNQKIEKYKTIASRMEQFRDIVKATLSYKVKEFRSTAHKVQDARLDFTQNNDVFGAIRGGSYSEFLNCFISGVKLSQTDHEGYTPLTYAVRMNMYEMVKFLIESGARPGESDARGMNAYLTAVENANGSLIKYLLKTDSSLADSSSDKGESAIEIAEKTNIGTWYKTMMRL
ncbi:MAG: dynamin family protein [Muribaculaceae bacterium]|nr:dynamin family protein [Muribaculaceae bacterium]